MTEVSEFEGEYGKAKRYEFIAEEGKVEGGELKAGETSSFLGHFTVDDKMKRIKLGQRFKVTRLDDRESTKRKGAKYKVLEVQSGPMDEKWLKENPVTSIPVADSNAPF